MSGQPSALPAVGQTAPGFVLPSTTNHAVDLTSFQGKSNVLLAFFPAAFTGVCTAEMCELSRDLPKFQSANGTVLGISVDSIPSLLEFQAKNGITITLLSDVRREVTRKYGVLNEEYFCAERSYFLVGTDGKIKWRHVERDLGEKRENGELLKQLARFG